MTSAGEDEAMDVTAMEQGAGELAQFEHASAEDPPLDDEDPEDEADPAAPAAAAVPAADPAAADPDPASRLNQIEAVLRQPDAIMEPDIMDRLREYVLADGHPPQAVELLTDSYVGYAQMASLACSWLRLAGEEGGAEEAEGGGGARSRGHPRPQAEHRPAKAEPGEAEAAVAGGAAELDEAHFLRELVKERFDPARFSKIFTAGGSGAPSWLNALIEDRGGRQLVYDLSARHPHSLLLNFAIQKILMQPEREEEVAAAGSTLVGYFGVFHRLTAARLRQVAAARSVEELARPAREIREGCARSQHAYAHTQHLLAWLAAEGGPGAARFRRLSQELEAAAAEAAGPAALKMQRWFTPGGGGGGGAAAVAAAVADVLAVASGVSAAPSSDVLKLYRMYCPPPGEGAPPAAAAVGPLRQPRLIEVLLRGLFNPGRQLAGEAATAHVTLLSLATAALEPAKGAGAEPAAAAAAAAAMEVDGAAAAAAAGAPQPASALLDQPGVASARAALESAAHVGHKALRDEALSEAEAAAAVAAAGHSVAAAGLLGMLRARLTSPDYWTTSYHVHKEPPFLALLSAIVARQPDMHGQALTLVTDALAAMGTSASGPDVARGLLDVALQLLAAGRADEVLRWGEAWARNADAGLVRHLTFGLLRRAAPPYSPAFAAAVLRLMAVGGMRRQRVGGREWAVRAPLLEEFERGCAGVAFSPPLAGEAAAALRELGAGLRAGRQQG